MTEEITTYSEDTLRKVYEALLDNGIYGEKATGIVSAIQGKGILFRERTGKRRGRPPGSKNRKTSKPANEPEKELEKAPTAPVEAVSEATPDTTVLETPISGSVAWDPKN